MVAMAVKLEKTLRARETSQTLWRQPPMPTYRLNERALQLAEREMSDRLALNVDVREVEGGGRTIDCGIDSGGGLDAGILLARLTLADLANVRLEPGEVGGRPCPVVCVSTDAPVAACLASQYAGWQVSVGDFFGMGSGPMRAARGAEDLFDTIGHRETCEAVLGVLETGRLPGKEVFELIAEKTGVPTSAVTLACAPTACLAGGLQIVSRSVETALHKLHEIEFDLSRLVAGFGTAPLPPVAKNDLRALGRTNDAILYGARVVLWARGDDDSLEEACQRVPSSASSDHGEPFGDIFARYEHDFYKIDPMLFSPAEIVLQNIDTGRSFHAGECRPDVLVESFFGG